MQQVEDEIQREEEFGDVLFSLANVARWLKIDPEAALRAANHKFRARFREVERLAREQDRPLIDALAAREVQVAGGGDVEPGPERAGGDPVEGEPLGRLGPEEPRAVDGPDDPAVRSLFDRILDGKGRDGRPGGAAGNGKAMSTDPVELGNLVRSDVERKRLHGLDALADSQASGVEIYTPQAGRQTRQQLQQGAEHQIEKVGEKLREIVHRDFTDFASVEQELAGFDACFFCLGVSSAGMTEENYTRVTRDLTRRFDDFPHRESISTAHVVDEFVIRLQRFQRKDMGADFRSSL